MTFPQEPVVSVITPTYNRARLLRETIASILAQQGPAFEYIVIDDGSSDDTAEVVAGFGDPRIRYHYQPNRGESHSVNAGWALARAPYVAVVSSDDPVLPGWLEASVAVLEARPEINVTYPDWHVVDATGAIEGTVETVEFSTERALACFVGIPGPGAVIRRSALAPGELPRNPSYRYAPDMDQWLRLAMRGEFARIPRVLATWRSHQGSITVSERSHAYADELLRVARTLYQRADMPRHLRALEPYALGRAAYLAAHVLEARSPWRAHRLMRWSYRVQPTEHPSTPANYVRPACPTRRETFLACAARLGLHLPASFPKIPSMTGVTPAITAPRERAYYPGLQAIRGLACLGVYLQHAYGYGHLLSPGPTAMLDKLNLGGSGIMLFFALSAFIMLERSGDPFGRFVLDRLRRIFPLLWTSLLIAGAASYFVHGASGLRWRTFLLIPTTIPAYVPVPFWSLSFELFFYLLVAFAGLRGYNAVVTVVLLWCAVSAGFHQAPYDSLNHALYPQVYPFFVTVFGYFFAAGILARLGFNRDSSWRWIYALGAVGIYIAVYWNLLPSWMFATVPADRHTSMIFALLAVGCFLAVRAGALWTPRSWPSRMLVKIGDYSYGIYLMHMVGMMVVHMALARIGGLGFWTATAVMVVVPMVPSILWGIIDLRMQRWLKRFGSKRRVTETRHDAPASASLAPEGTATLT